MNCFGKILLTGVVCVVTIGACMAQYDTTGLGNEYNYVRPKNGGTSGGSNFISFGVGTGGYYPYEGPAYSQTPNLSLVYEHIIFKHVGPGNIGIGALVSYKEIVSGYTNYSTNYNYFQNWDYYIVGARVAYHFNPIPGTKLSPYFGGMAGYYITNFRFSSNDPDYNEPSDPGYYLTSGHYPNFFAASIFGGIRAQFSNRGIFWAEGGYGYISFAFGISYKL